MVRENVSRAEVALLVFEGDFVRLLEDPLISSSSDRNAVFALGIVLARTNRRSIRTFKDLMTTAKLDLVGPVELPHVADALDAYPAQVRQQLEDMEMQRGAHTEATDVEGGETFSSLFDQAGTTAKPLRDQLIRARDQLVERRERGWGDPATLEELVDRTKNSIETAAGELGIGSESDTMRTITAACTELRQGAQLLKTDGPGSAKASAKLGAGITGLEAAMHQL
jgi:hypothetical protein